MDPVKKKTVAVRADRDQATVLKLFFAKSTVALADDLAVLSKQTGLYACRYRVLLR